MHNKMRAGEWFTCLHVLPASDEMNIPVLEKDSSGPMLPERENTTVTLIDIIIPHAYAGDILVDEIWFYHSLLQ